MPKVLIIEDRADIRSVLRRQLEPAGYEVREAEDGVQGLKQYEEEAADVVVLDLFMPVKDGLETIRDLRRYDPDAKIVAISGGGSHANMGMLQAAMHMGAAKALLKPIRREELLATLSEVLAPSKP